MSAHPSVRLVAFDLDGTLTRGPTVCEAIADALGHGARMRELEQLRDLDAIRSARELMAQWYRCAPRELLVAYQTGTRLAPGAEKAFAWLREREILTAIVSVTWTFAVSWFATRLGADYYVGTGLLDSGHIEHMWPYGKAEWLAARMRQMGLGPMEVAAVGDSAGDIPMLKAVGHPVFVGAELPAEIEHAWHAPDADLLHIVKRLCGTRRHRNGGIPQHHMTSSTLH